jgi:hypothetical protein
MIQRRAAKFVFKNKYKTSNFTFLINNLGWNTLEQRTKFVSASPPPQFNVLNNAETTFGNIP